MKHCVIESSVIAALFPVSCFSGSRMRRIDPPTNLLHLEIRFKPMVQDGWKTEIKLRAGERDAAQDDDDDDDGEGTALKHNTWLIIHLFLTLIRDLSLFEAFPSRPCLLAFNYDLKT